MKKLFFTIGFLLAFSFSNAQISFSANEKGDLICKGTLPFKDKSESEVLNCILENDILESIKSHNKDSVTGAYQYNYYALDNKTSIGEISFEYTYTIKKDVIEYTFYNFKHDKGSSKLNAAGILPLNLNDNLKQVFTQAQYDKILSEQQLNITSWFRLLNRFCLN